MTTNFHEHPPLSFTDIHQQELFEIQKRREKHAYDPTEYDQTHPELVGLALSGGGIRSATFCLGFLQELQRLRLLRIFDYLSTVSGGGYLGGWWSAWLSRKQDEPWRDTLFTVQDIHDPIKLLRRIKEAHGSTAHDLKKHFQSTVTGRNLLEALDRTDLRQLAPRLYEPLTEELNSYIYNAGPTEEEQQLRKVDLIDAFPCELRDIFPTNEKIEPERTHIRKGFSTSSYEDPTHHIRLFADYLTPPKGIFNAGTWRAISTITRNLILTWLILLSLFVGVMLLGQAYLFLHPASQPAVTCLECPVEGSRLVLLVVLQPVFILLVSNIVMGIAWLLCNQDNASSLDSVTQWACLLALAALIIAAILAIPSWRVAIADYFALPLTIKYVVPRPWSPGIPEILAPHVTRLRVVIIWLAVLLGYILTLWHWRLKGGPPADEYASSPAPSSWKQEIRRARFARAQSRLLVTTAIVAAVLIVSWLTPLLLRENQFTLGMKLPLALLPLLWNLRGSIFATLEDSPAFFGDKAARKKASLASRFIFAMTPLLVVGVLAVAATAFANWLMFSLYAQNSEFQTISVLVNVAAFLAVTLCMVLAIYELKAVFRASLLLIVFLGLVMINVVWEAQALLRYANEPAGGPWLYLLVTSAGSAILITALVFRKIIPRGKWKWRFVRHLNVVGSRIKDRGENQRLLRRGSTLAAVLLFISLTLIGLVIGYGIYLNSVSATGVGRVSGALVLTLLALGGGVILFRLMVRRERTWSGENLITLRLFPYRAIGQRPEGLWIAQSICLTLPIVMVSFSHYILWYGEGHLPVAWYQSMTLLPVTVGLLVVTVMVLRSLVIQKRLLQKTPIAAWSGEILDWLIDRLPIANAHRRVYGWLAAISIGSVVLLETATRVVSSRDTTAAALAGPIHLRLLVVTTLVSLPLFVNSMFQIPVTVRSDQLLNQGKLSWLHNKAFLWFLSTICVGLALIAGLLLPNWLIHVSEIPLHTGLTPLLLPLAAGCVLIVLFEFGWDKGDNQRSVVLVAVAYFAVTSIFFMQLTGTGLNWYLVLGLLAAICVWVGALGWVVDPNSVSMHQFYKERLVRAYLGASNVRRFRHRRKEIVETIAGDDLPLRSLLNCERGGPYHLINTTLNLAAGRDVATAQRSTSSFVLSQHYCGSTRTHYCDTNEYMMGRMTLGTAVAVSGAPVSSNPGGKKPTASLAMLMTLLNVRLGYWAPTPNRAAQNSVQPRLWPFYLLREFFSQTNELSDYCYLSDGGDFDNTGLYSLIERGCRFVVVIDCGADSKPPRFEDIGEAIRRCRLDFGTEIDLKLDSLAKSESPASCFVIGKIRFAENHLHSLGRNLNPAQRYGTIIYFKPSVIREVSADVWQYAIENEFFPQQPATDQLFGEAQFESYRRLGQACAHSAFGWFRNENELEHDGRLSTRKIAALFTRLQKQNANP